VRGPCWSSVAQESERRKGMRAAVEIGELERRARDGIAALSFPAGTVVGARWKLVEAAVVARRSALSSWDREPGGHRAVARSAGALARLQGEAVFMSKEVVPGLLLGCPHPGDREPRALGVIHDCGVLVGYTSRLAHVGSTTSRLVSARSLVNSCSPVQTGEVCCLRRDVMVRGFASE
jgi:hypothetical protein